MNANVAILKEHGIRLTPQRLAVYEMLKSDRTHPTAEAIYGRLKKKHPALSLATVYAILELFQEKKLVRQLRIKAHESCFDGMTEHHHHFYCRKCGVVYDVEMPPCLASREGRAHGHHIEEIQGYFFGICKSCGKA